MEQRPVRCPLQLVGAHRLLRRRATPGRLAFDRPGVQAQVSSSPPAGAPAGLAGPRRAGQPRRPGPVGRGRCCGRPGERPVHPLRRQPGRPGGALTGRVRHVRYQVGGLVYLPVRSLPPRGPESRAGGGPRRPPDHLSARARVARPRDPREVRPPRPGPVSGPAARRRPRVVGGRWRAAGQAGERDLRPIRGPWCRGPAHLWPTTARSK